jgi:hypothetical protein
VFGFRIAGIVEILASNHCTTIVVIEFIAAITAIAKYFIVAQHHFVGSFDCLYSN